jgi:carboxyvinyl-carboxyphosphonate phosphorylmutase
MTKRERLRAILNGSTCVHPASVVEPLGMRAAQEIGYEAVMMGGSLVSLAVLGAPDVAVLTLTELAEQVRRVCRAGDLPVVVDGDHGYGNALSVRRTVEELEAAGAAAVTVEDTLLPAAFGTQKASLIAVKEAVGKIRAALDARTDPLFSVIGRTNAALAPASEVLARQRAFEDAGADALFIANLKTLDELDALAKQARVPLLLGSVIPGVGTQELAARKVRLSLKGHQAAFDAIAAQYRRLHQIRHGQEPADLDARKLVKQLSQDERYARWAEEFLK